MKRSTLWLLLLSLGVAGCVTQDPLTKWRTTADVIPIGSSRKYVESVLPPLMMSPMFQTGAMVTWWVDEDVYLTATYAGKDETLSHPIKLERKTMPRIEVKDIRIQEQKPTTGRTVPPSAGASGGQ